MIARFLKQRGHMGLDIKCSAYRGGYGKDVHFRNIATGSTNCCALAVCRATTGKELVVDKQQPDAVLCAAHFVHSRTLHLRPAQQLQASLTLKGCQATSILDVAVDNSEVFGGQRTFIYLLTTYPAACTALASTVPGINRQFDPTCKCACNAK